MVPLNTADEVRAVLGSLVERLDDANAAMDWHAKTIHQYSETAEKYKLRAACYEDVLRLILALPSERLDEVPWMVERALEQ